MKNFDLPPEMVTEEDRLVLFSFHSWGLYFFFFCAQSTPHLNSVMENLMYQRNKLWNSQWKKSFLKSEKLMKNF